MQADEWQNSLSRDTYLLNLSRNLILQERAVEIFKELKRMGIDFLLLKGVYFAYAVYPDIGLRPMADIDILIEYSDLEEVCSFFSHSGYQELSRPEQKIYGCDATFLSPANLAIDIHWDLCQYERFKGIINITEDFWERAVEFDLDGMRARTLSVEDHILYVALHYCLVHLCEDIKGAYDIFYLVKKFNPDWGKIIENASKYGIKIPLYYSLQKSQEISGLKLPDFVLPRLMPHPFKKKIIDYLLGRCQNLIFRILAQALMLHSFCDTVRVLGKTLMAIPRAYRNAI